ncbi:MAG TPA: threonine--tRNA ligase, partial [archaeon]|nr:threonine--tRNA ligase [archaeon]
RCGPLIDLCKGPHVPSSGVIKAFEATKVSSSYFLADAANDSLQRVYGVSFPDTKLMKEYKKRMEEAAKRDHRRVGVEQELFFFSELSPGSAFFLPNGARMYNRLVELMRSEDRKRGYQEVVSPNIFKSALWKTSGHWEHYQDDMFTFDCEGERFGLKPMNCPGHCVLFGHRIRTFKEMPLRMAEFGVLHRNELSGTLSGLTRVRRFAQDDAHIFCRPDQLQAEVLGCLDLMRFVYELFGLEFALELSTRPKKFMGEIEVWDRAEAELKTALDSFVGPSKWKLNPGDGAFYGPKIDIHVRDALGRNFQCATVQVDFQLPIKFDLHYQADNGEMVRPVIVHRAILGSLERFMGIIVEHLGGRWPLWLSPRQIAVLTVMNVPELNEYAEKVRARFHEEGFDIDLDAGGDKINKKVRNAEVRHYNYIFVIGRSEVANGTVNVRSGVSNEVLGEVPLEQQLSAMLDMVRRRAI